MALQNPAPLFRAAGRQRQDRTPVSDWISLVEYPNDGKPMAPAGYFPQLGEAAAKFLARQLSNPKYHGPSAIAELDKLVSTPGFEFKDRVWWNGFIDSLTSWAGGEHKVPPSLSRALLKFKEDEAARSGQADIARELEAISLQFRCGQATEGWALLSEYLAMVKQRRPAGAAGNLRSAAGSDQPAGRTRRHAQAGHAVSHAVEGGQAGLRAGCGNGAGAAPSRPGVRGAESMDGANAEKMGIEALNHILFAADHQAIASIGPPHSAAGLPVPRSGCLWVSVRRRGEGRRDNKSSRHR